MAVIEVQLRCAWRRLDSALEEGVPSPVSPRRTLLFSVAAEEEVGVVRNNYDGELAARLAVLNRTGRAGARRGLVVVDATSPLEASRCFRRADVRARARKNCDDWLGSTLLMEDDHEELIYWWTRSHLETKDELASGSYSVNAAADELCERFLHDDATTPVPVRTPRHVQMRFAAKASERTWARGAAQRRAVERLGRTRVHSIRARPTDTDVFAIRSARRWWMRGRTGPGY